MTPVTHTFIIKNAVGQLCKVYQAGGDYYTDAQPLRLCNDYERSVVAPPALALTPEELIAWVAMYFGLSVAEMLAEDRRTSRAYPRHLCVYLLTEDFRLSKAHIARLLHRDRAAISSAYSKINSKQHDYHHIKNDLCNIRAKLNPPSEKATR